MTVAGLNGVEPVKCSRDIVILPDKSLDQAISGDPYDAVVLPGGLGGSNAMGESKAVGELLRTQESSERIIAAICAAPTALAKHGIATGKSVTSYPAMKPQLVDKYRLVLISLDIHIYLSIFTYNFPFLFSYVDDKNVVQDGNLITSRGPGTAYEFALKLSEQLVGLEKAQEVAKGLLLTFN